MSYQGIEGEDLPHKAEIAAEQQEKGHIPSKDCVTEHCQREDRAGPEHSQVITHGHLYNLWLISWMVWDPCI